LNLQPDNWLTLQNGTFIYSSTITDLTISQGTIFNIPATAGLTINTSRNVYIANNAVDNKNLYLSGKLTLAAGNTGNTYIGPSAAPATHNDMNTRAVEHLPFR